MTRLGALGSGRNHKSWLAALFSMVERLESVKHFNTVTDRPQKAQFMIW